MSGNTLCEKHLLIPAFAWRHVRPLGWALLPFVVAVWVGTLAFGWHYGVDVWAGIAVGIAAIVGARWAIPEPSKPTA